MAYHIKGALIAKMSGFHALRYLQARSSNDMRLVQPQKSILNAVLDHHGKAEAVFRVMFQDKESFILIFDGGTKEELSNALLRYKVAEQLELSWLDDLQLIHLSDLELAKISKEANIPAELGVVFSTELLASQITGITVNRLLERGVDLLIAKENLTDLTGKLTWLSDAEFYVERVKAGIPCFPVEVNSRRILLESPVMRAAVSFKKGCYVGQEVLERVDSRGKLPKTLVAVTGEVAVGEISLSTEAEQVRVGDGIKVVRADDQSGVGEMVSSICQESAFYGFASIKNNPELLAVPLKIGETRVRVVTV